jgi:antitoxin MazE
MTTAIVKWGNSQGIRLPKTFLQNINLSENDKVDVLMENKTIIIKRATDKKHFTTKERLMEFYGKNKEVIVMNTKKQKEVDWGDPIGKELW